MAMASNIVSKGVMGGRKMKPVIVDDVLDHKTQINVRGRVPMRCSVPTDNIRQVLRRTCGENYRREGGTGAHVIACRHRETVGLPWLEVGECVGMVTVAKAYSLLFFRRWWC
jgi:hypothetical protein